jgi:hypothetical protein
MGGYFETEILKENKVDGTDSVLMVNDKNQYVFLVNTVVKFLIP